MKKETEIKIAVIIGLVIILALVLFKLYSNITNRYHYLTTEFSEVKVDSGYSCSNQSKFGIADDDSVELNFVGDFEKIYIISETDTLVFTYTERRMKNKKEMK